MLTVFVFECAVFVFIVTVAPLFLAIDVTFSVLLVFVFVY